MPWVGGLAVVLAFVSGAFRPRIVERLRSPIAVVGWSQSGLKLGDGRIVTLPGIRALPTSSAALAEATKRGVELGPDGRVYGLVRVHHWCGNDPLKEHIARVDLARVLAFLHEGQPVAPPIPGVTFEIEAGGRFSPSGWEVGEYNAFRCWCRLVEEEKNRAPQRPRASAAQIGPSVRATGAQVR